MNSQDFVIWLRGFTEGVHDFNITPKQWDLLKEKLSTVEEPKFVETPGMFQVHPQPPYPGVPIGPNGTGTPNMHDLVDRYPWGGPVVWGTTSHGNPLTTSGYIARTDTPVNNSATITVSSGSGGIVYTTTDTVDTRTMMQSGSWHYTTSNDKTLLND